MAAVATATGASMLNLLDSNNMAQDSLNNSSSQVLPPTEILSNAINEANSDYNFLNTVMHSANLDSPSDLVNIQQKIQDFTVTTQLIGKTASLVVKAVDTLTKLQ